MQGARSVLSGRTRTLSDYRDARTYCEQFPGKPPEYFERKQLNAMLH
jgi:hypothetical protein